MTTIATTTDVRLRCYRLVPVTDRRWRVTDAAGRVIGHVDRTGDPHTPRYRARRFRVSTGGFLELGEFWHLEDAVAVLHDSR